MSGRTPARLLAPLALVATAIALFTVLSSGDGGDSATERREGDRPARTSPTPTPRARTRGGTRRYTVKPGDTPSSIAAEADIPLDRLLELNPDIDPQALTPGQRLRLGR